MANRTFVMGGEGETSRGINKMDTGVISLTVQTKGNGPRSGVPNFQEGFERGGDILRKILNYKGGWGNQPKIGIITHCTDSCYA